MTWIISSLENFQNQREMRLRMLIREAWLRIRESLQIILRITSSPSVSTFKTLKEAYVALTKMFEGNNINWKVTLRNQWKNLKIHNSETTQSYFTRVSQIKEQLEAVEENVEQG